MDATAVAFMLIMTDRDLTIKEGEGCRQQERHELYTCTCLMCLLKHLGIATADAAGWQRHLQLLTTTPESRHDGADHCALPTDERNEEDA